MSPMGAWGPGLWSDDTAADVRSGYREALEDGLEDEAATSKVLATFAAQLDDPDDSPVVWLALAVAQSNAGRLSDEVRARAIDAIDSGSDIRRWFDADAKTVAKRHAVLAKTRDQLTGEQPARKRIRKPAIPVTTLKPGEVLAYRAGSGRVHLLAVRAIHETRYWIAPAVELLDFADTDLPHPRALARLRARKEGAGPRGGAPAEPWWRVNGHVLHRRGQDFADAGFELVAILEALPCHRAACI